MEKSLTNQYWNERAKAVKNDIEVNIMDIFQRNLEYEHICKYLTKEMKLLEAGCGMGISTDKFRSYVKWVDAFDCEENMILRANQVYGVKNNNFFLDNVLDIKNLKGSYDAITCVRVLINLRDLEEQKAAVMNLTNFLNPRGLFILVEGFTEGFAEMNQVRKKLDLPPLEAARINFYSSINDLMPLLMENYTLENEFHLGAYDYLTRIVYPAIVGHANAKHNTEFSEKSEQIARAFNDDALRKFSRIKGLILRKK